MTPEQFCHWLCGVTSLIKEAPTKEQWGNIRSEAYDVVKLQSKPTSPQQQQYLDNARRAARQYNTLRSVSY